MQIRKTIQRWWQQRRYRHQLDVMRVVREARYRALNERIRPRPETEDESLRRRKVYLKQGYLPQARRSEEGY